MIAFSLPVFRRGLVVGRLCKPNNNNNDNINKKKKESMKNKIFGLTNIFKNLIEILRKCFLKGPIHRLCKCLFNTVPRMHTNLVCHVWSRYKYNSIYVSGFFAKKHSVQCTHIVLLHLLHLRTGSVSMRRFRLFLGQCRSQR